MKRILTLVLVMAGTSSAFAQRHRNTIAISAWGNDYYDCVDKLEAAAARTCAAGSVVGKISFFDDTSGLPGADRCDGWVYCPYGLH